MENIKEIIELSLQGKGSPMMNSIMASELISEASRRGFGVGSIEVYLREDGYDTPKIHLGLYGDELDSVYSSKSKIEYLSESNKLAFDTIRRAALEPGDHWFVIYLDPGVELKI